MKSQRSRPQISGAAPRCFPGLRAVSWVLSAHLRSVVVGCLIALSVLFLTSSSLKAQEPAGTVRAVEADPAATPKTDITLAARQEAISLRYRRFEKSLLEMAEAMRKSDPERAALLVRAVGKSHEDRNSQQMSKVIDLLKEERLGDATERQGDLVGTLQSLLDLLSSEDRDKEREKRKKEIEEYLKKLNKIIAGQKDVRAATERGEPADGLAPRQEKLKDRARDLRKEIEKDDEARDKAAGERDAESKPGDQSGDQQPGEEKPGENKPGEGKPGESPGEKKPSGEDRPGEDKPGEEKPKEDKPGEKKPGEQKPGEKKPGEAKPGEKKPGESKPGESKPGESKPGESKPGESKPGESKPGETQPGESQPGETQPEEKEKTPGREEIERARQEMEKAIDNLKKNGLPKASDNQNEALKELEKAKEKLEEILRQLREEEKDKLLSALEARFQKMLAMQLIVFNDTVQLGKIPVADRVERHTNKSVQLSRQEAEIAIEAMKALTLLREEGTAVAFPEAVEQMREDMRLVVGRLERVDVGELTQSIEEDIIEALKEMIEALQKEMEKKDKKQQQAPPSQPAQPQDPSLVETLAELKMLRSLQLRVNGRTQRLGREVSGEQATQAEIVNQLQKLSARQARIQKATYDLATGRNK